MTLKALCFVHLEWLVDGEEGYIVSMRLGKKMSNEAVPDSSPAMGDVDMLYNNFYASSDNEVTI